MSHFIEVLNQTSDGRVFGYFFGMIIIIGIICTAAIEIVKYWRKK